MHLWDLAVVSFRRRPPWSAPEEDDGTAGALEALLTTPSLSDPDLMSATDIVPDQRILPDESVLKIGGQSPERTVFVQDVDGIDVGAGVVSRIGAAELLGTSPTPCRSTRSCCG